jgi:mRNA-degrading endonuclease RelE of RelBE toxin-antitoxin system
MELPPFARRRADYLKDDDYRRLQWALMANPTAGPMVQGTGGLRKLRWSDSSGNKGKRGGIRIIYYYWAEGNQFWLFTLYGKNEMPDLNEEQKKAVRDRLKDELAARKRKWRRP